MEKLEIRITVSVDMDNTEFGQTAIEDNPTLKLKEFEYFVDGETFPTTIYLSKGEKIPFEIVSALWNPEVLKTADNVDQVRAILQNWLKTSIFSFKKFGKDDWKAA